LFGGNGPFRATHATVTFMVHYFQTREAPGQTAGRASNRIPFIFQLGGV
jgi:hypothetical protein